MTSANVDAERVDTEVDANYRIEVSKLDGEVLLRISEMAFRHRARMGIGIAATILAAIFQLYIPQYLGLVFN